MDFDSIKKLSSNDINDIISSKIEKKSNCVGKVIDTYNWKIVGIINTTNQYIKGTDVDIKINGINEIIPAYVEDMTELGDNN